MAKRVSVFESLDGKHFDTNKGAEVHDAGIILMQAFMDLGYANKDGDLKKMCVDFAKKFTTNEKLGSAIQNIRRAHSLKS